MSRRKQWPFLMKIYQNKFHEWEFSTVYVDTTHDAIVCLDKLDSTKLYGLDLECSKKPTHVTHPMAGLDPYLSDIRLLQVYDDGSKRAYVFDIKKLGLEVFSKFLKEGRFVAHNAKYEISMLLFAGYKDLNVGCSMLLSMLITGAEKSPYETDPEEDDTDKTGLSQYRAVGHSLDAVTQRLFGVKVNKQEQTSDWSKEELSLEQITYAGLDGLLTYKAAIALIPKLKEYKLERYYKSLKDVQQVVAEMEINGLPVDRTGLLKLIEEWKNGCEKAKIACEPFFKGINMRSSSQMSIWLKEYLKDRPADLANWPKTPKGSYTFTKSAIGAFIHLPAIKVLLDYKRFSKLLDTYGDSLIEKIHPVTGNLHSSFTLGMTRTGRLSSREPNIQNAPRDKTFRDIFRTHDDKYVLVVSDYSMIEIRLEAFFSKDPVMVNAFKNKEDVYKILASTLFKVPVDKVTKDQRFVGKVCMLSLSFGMGVKKLSQYALNAGIKEPLLFWQNAHKVYHTTFRVYSEWCTRMRDRCAKLGYSENILGGRRKLHEDEMYCSAVNNTIQSSAGCLMMRALCLCNKYIAGKGKLLASIHDEIIVLTHMDNAEEVKQMVTDAMNHSMQELFPAALPYHVAETKVGRTWGECK